MYSLLLVVICVVLVAADQQARLCKSVEKRRRLIKWKRCILSFSFERSAVGSNVYVTKVTSFGLVDTSSFGMISRDQQIDCFEERVVTSSWLFACESCSQLLLLLNFTKRKEKIAADRLLLNTSMDLSESAGED
ncbi:RING finger protein 10-like [Dorcoceras hygrometricum]|uniref:RING finger protein 10-like n=1 Tax=Dorcoceras hygrometricum TaxID=472368 RepID=A0A2Z6ZWH3_9LAMI|nr:RING finger protein 10-like [Dorcoceras hygrometricum]